MSPHDQQTSRLLIDESENGIRSQPRKMIFGNFDIRNFRHNSIQKSTFFDHANGRAYVWRPSFRSHFRRSGHVNQIQLDIEMPRIYGRQINNALIKVSDIDGTNNIFFLREAVSFFMTQFNSP